MAEVNFGLDESTYRYPSEINLFSLPDLTNTYVSQEFIDFRPTTANLNSGGSIDFLLPPTINSYTSLRETRLHMRVRIVNEDSTPIDMADMVGPANWPGCTLFESCQLFLNQTLVSATGGLDYGYRGIIQALVDRHRFQRDTVMQLGLYEEDEPGLMNNFEQGGTPFMRRWQYFAKSESVDLISPIISDLAEQGRLILNNIEISMKFHPAKPSHCLNTAIKGRKFKVEFLDCFLRVCRKVVQPAILVAMTNALEVSTAKYPYMRTELRKFIVQRGLYTYTQDLLYDGIIPSYMVLAFVTAAAASGQYNLNGYNFITANVSSIQLYVDDKAVTPGFKMNFNGADFLKSEFTDGLESLYRETNDPESELPSSYCQIRRNSYTRGYCLYMVKFNDSGKFLPVQPHANLKINVEFRTPPTENLQLLLYARFPSILTIDKTRRVTV